METDLPELALSVRQPWAWAIIHAGKDIENRSPGSIRAGNMRPGRICIHAASGLTQDEYLWAVWRLDRHGVRCPAPLDLVRSAIIGTVDVVEVVTKSDSDWFGGTAGLRLADPQPVDPVPAKGALGYFRWVPSGACAAPLPWMQRFEASGTKDPGLFSDLPVQFAQPPRKPFGSK